MDSNRPDLMDSLPAEVTKELTPSVMRYVLLFTSGLYTQEQIAKIMDVTMNQVRTWSGKPYVKAVVTEIQKRETEVFEQQLNSLKGKAISKLGELLDTADAKTQLAAVKTVLDRTGIKSSTTVEINNVPNSVEAKLKHLDGFDINSVVDVSDEE